MGGRGRGGALQHEHAASSKRSSPAFSRCTKRSPNNFASQFAKGMPCKERRGEGSILLSHYPYLTLPFSYRFPGPGNPRPIHLNGYYQAKRESEKELFPNPEHTHIHTHAGHRAQPPPHNHVCNTSGISKNVSAVSTSDLGGGQTVQSTLLDRRAWGVVGLCGKVD
jgi:hypothetical protein